VKPIAMHLPPLLGLVAAAGGAALLLLGSRRQA
jgi:hypothetical protein